MPQVHHVTHPIFEYLIAEFARRVEPIHVGTQDDWAYTPKKIAGTSIISNHASGTAVDINARKHPQFKKNTFTPAQVREIRAILTELDDVVQWGGDWGSRVDEMHFEIRGSVSERKVREVAARLAHGTPSRTAQRTITVRKGDGWWQTAQRAGVSMSDLLEANSATVERVLKPNEELAIPGRAISVRAGEGWWSVATRAGIPMSDLLEANGKTVKDVIHPGQILNLPS